MSGGNWDYFGRRFDSELKQFCNDIKTRFPELSTELLKKGNIICEVLNVIDYDVCGDTMIKNDNDFEYVSIKKLKSVK